MFFENFSVWISVIALLLVTIFVKTLYDNYIKVEHFVKRKHNKMIEAIVKVLKDIENISEQQANVLGECPQLLKHQFSQELESSENNLQIILDVLENERKEREEKLKLLIQFCTEWRISQLKELKIIQQPVPLMNIGNTCFMNAVLQILCASPAFAYSISCQREILMRNKMQRYMTTAVFNLLCYANNLYEKDKVCWSVPKGIYEAMGKRSGHFSQHTQQDSRDCFNTVMCILEDDLDDCQEISMDFIDKDSMIKESKEVIQFGKCKTSYLFTGSFITIYYFEDCQHVKTTYQHFKSVSVPVLVDDSPPAAKLADQSQQNTLDETMLPDENSFQDTKTKHVKSIGSGLSDKSKTCISSCSFGNCDEKVNSNEGCDDTNATNNLHDRDTLENTRGEEEMEYDDRGGKEYLHNENRDDANLAASTNGKPDDFQQVVMCPDVSTVHTHVPSDHILDSPKTELTGPKVPCGNDNPNDSNSTQSEPDDEERPYLPNEHSSLDNDMFDQQNNNQSTSEIDCDNGDNGKNNMQQKAASISVKHIENEHLEDYSNRQNPSMDEVNTSNSRTGQPSSNGEEQHIIQEILQQGSQAMDTGSRGITIFQTVGEIPSSYTDIEKGLLYGLMKEDTISELPCRKCSKVNQSCIKKTMIAKAPLLLMVHINRFQEKEGESGELEKIKDNVTYPETLDLSFVCCSATGKEHSTDCFNSTYSYKLYGVIVHIGDIKGGHYVAYIKGKPRANITKFQEILQTKWTDPVHMKTETERFFEEEMKNESQQTETIDRVKSNLERNDIPYADQSWYCTNDSQIAEVHDSSALHNENAYILVYEKNI